MIPIIKQVSDYEDPIQIRRIKMMQASSFEVQWTFLQSGLPVDLNDVDQVYFVYSDDSTFTETITGTVEDADAGVVSFTFTPTNSANNGVFDFYISATDVSESEVNLFPYGELTLLAKAGDGITQTLPTTNVTVVSNCSANSTTIELTDHTKTFIMDSDLACDWTFQLPTADSPTDYIGTWFRFINRTDNICIVQAETGDSIDDSSVRSTGTTGQIRSVDSTGLNPSPWCSLEVMLAGNSAGVCWWHAYSGRRIWSTTI